MHIALIAPPFIEIPPRRYGGTELFVANLARALHARGCGVTVYANGESRLPCPVKWLYDRADWPPEDAVRAQLKHADHTAWAMRDAARSADIVHLNDLVGLPMTRFLDVPTVLTIHHTHDATLSEQYMRYPDVRYVAIARWLAGLEPMPQVSVVHHGIRASEYVFSADKDDYAVFLGRMAPCKGPHLAIEAAARAGVRLVLAGEIQPVFRDYWDEQVAPKVDGRNVQYVGEADFTVKSELLSRARALLFPIQWDEPFGLVMIEAMACGTPVLAFRGGAVAEIVRDGVNGWVCADVDDMAARLTTLDIAPSACRSLVERCFSVEAMADTYIELYLEALSRTDPAPVARRA